MDFSNINWLACIVAGVAAWVLGALWYSPFLFGKTWQKELGFTEEELKKANMAVIFGGSLVLMIIMAIGVAVLCSHHANGGAIDGLKCGLLIGVFFAATSIGINYLYQRKSLKLYFIDALYQIALIGVIGLIVGCWR